MHAHFSADLCLHRARDVQVVHNHTQYERRPFWTRFANLVLFSSPTTMVPRDSARVENASTMPSSLSLSPPLSLSPMHALDTKKLRKNGRVAAHCMCCFGAYKGIKVSQQSLSSVTTTTAI